MKQFLSENDKNINYDRLIGHHGVKSHYFVSGENLQLYLKNGLEIIKVHSGYKFSQEAFLESYINKNIKSRKLAKNDFESNIIKLANNAIFGKLLCNVLNYSNKTYICTEQQKFIKLINSELFQRLHVLSENKCLLICKKKSIKLNFPNFISFQILEKAKRINYEIFYEVLMVTLKSYNPSLIYADTDSFIIKYHVPYKTSNDSAFWENVKILKALKNKGIMDFSNYHKHHPLFQNSSKGCLGLLKDEFPRSVISEFVGLSPKMYSIKLSDYHIKNVQINFKNQLFKIFGLELMTSIYHDYDSLIFKIETHDRFEKHYIPDLFRLVNIKLEPYYVSKITFMHSISQSFTKSKNFYDNELFKGIQSPPKV